MSQYHEDPADDLADYCERNHTDRPDSECANCAVRSEIQHCGQCGADHVDGQWWTALGSTTPNGCDHEALVDDWQREITCPVETTTEVWNEHLQMLYPLKKRCGDAVVPGKTACDHHQRILDAEECSRIYQRLVTKVAS